MKIYHQSFMQNWKENGKIRGDISARNDAGGESVNRFV